MRAAPRTRPPPSTPTDAVDSPPLPVHYLSCLCSHPCRGTLILSVLCVLAYFRPHFLCSSSRAALLPPTPPTCQQRRSLSLLQTDLAARHVSSASGMRMACVRRARLALITCTTMTTIRPPRARRDHATLIRLTTDAKLASCACSSRHSKCSSGQVGSLSSSVLSWCAAAADGTNTVSSTFPPLRSS